MSIVSPVARWGRVLPFVVLAACGTAPTESSRVADAAPLATAAAADPAHIRQVIDQKNAQLIQAFIAGDAAGVAGMFTSDGVLMLNGMPQITGRAAIEQTLVGVFGAVKYHSVVANVQEVQLFGDYALEMGTTVFTYEAGGRTVVDQGKYVVGWKREPGGDWKIHRDISNVTSSAVR